MPPNILACAEILSLCAETNSLCMETHLLCAEIYVLCGNLFIMHGNLFTMHRNLCAAQKYFQVPADKGCNSSCMNYCNLILLKDGKVFQVQIYL